jgi:predicted nuclease of restriction endonuclease-like (RecB) superfamily
MKGLSSRNLEYMATLATRWTNAIAQQPAARLPWGHVMVILDKCATRETSDFYAHRAAEEGWTRGVLQAMIASQLHERSQPALTTFDRSLPDSDRQAVRELVKTRSSSTSCWPTRSASATCLRP